jgi:hypothetical protein
VAPGCNQAEYSKEGCGLERAVSSMMMILEDSRIEGKTNLISEA